MNPLHGLGLVVGLVIILLFLYAATCVRIVSQAKAYVIESFGKYRKTWHAGFHLKVPFVERVVQVVNLREQVLDFKPQAVITKDNVKMGVDSAVFFQITDPYKFTYGIQNPFIAIENLTSTALRNIFGEMELDESLTSRDLINTKLRAVLDEATDPWGIKVNRVELKSIVPPNNIQEAMEKQMRAERERRAVLLEAEGEKASAVLRAEGLKRSRVLEAEAEKEARILRAEAEKEAAIRQAEGEAEAILKVQEATAEGLRLLNASNPTKEILTIKSLEALAQVADGQATKLIIPSELQKIASLTATFAETMNAIKD
ncbi:MAG: SPFH/Band 7/PHB domain protein [Defluviitaleaceae bacterium]|nr:SPFH/Band 7/PHB domain protein [Defluviitaleaceae bacterium]